jgi:hypothetical protein
MQLTAEAGTLDAFVDFSEGSCKEISMDQRDWELLEKQLRGSNFFSDTIA